MQNPSDFEVRGVKVLQPNNLGLGLADASETVAEHPGTSDTIQQSMEQLKLIDEHGSSKSIITSPSRHHGNSPGETGFECKSPSKDSRGDLVQVDIDYSEDFNIENESNGEVAVLAMELENSDDRSTSKEYPFSVLNTEDVVQHMLDSIRDANTVLQLPTTTMRALLNHFKWDKVKLFEVYFDGDQEKLFEDASVFKPCISESSIQSPGDDEECEICYIQKPSSIMYGLECGHRFCNDCWSEHLTTKIIEGMGTIACAGFNCQIVVDDTTIMKLVTDDEVRLKFQYLTTISFVQCNRLMRWCPSAGCTNAIRVTWVDWRPVTCLCGLTFCFQCGEDWHFPVQCIWLKAWFKIYDKSFNWIAYNTKQCPKCKVPIQKVGGCNHIVCENRICNAEFCWMCLEPWNQHEGFWNCNRYDQPDDRPAQKSSRQRRIFYFSRYRNHRLSLTLTNNNLYTSVNLIMEKLQKLNFSWIDVQFLKKAVDVLCQCRQTLMYTYVFAFYLVKSNQSAIFEDNQRDLESATDILSSYLERDIDSKDLKDMMRKVRDKHLYCESRRQVLLEHVYEGYEKDWWVYNEFE